MIRHALAYLKGTRLRALVDIETSGLIYYRAPVTTSFHGRIPRGASLLVYGEGLGSLYFLCTIPDPAVEAEVIPPEDRLNEKYSGHAFVFGVGEIGRRLEILPEQLSGDPPV